jgi:protein involved in polysaccharide export with SLBB domain
VYVFGEVSSEGTVSFQDGETSQFYLDKRGGSNEYADNKNIFVLHPNGDTFKLGQKNKFLKARKNIDIYPGSIIFVPRKTSNSYLATQTIQAYAAILGNIGVSLASVSVLKD